MQEQTIAYSSTIVALRKRPFPDPRAFAVLSPQVLSMLCCMGFQVDIPGLHMDRGHHIDASGSLRGPVLTLKQDRYRGSARYKSNMLRLMGLDQIGLDSPNVEHITAIRARIAEPDRKVSRLHAFVELGHSRIDTLSDQPLLAGTKVSGPGAVVWTND